MTLIGLAMSLGVSGGVVADVVAVVSAKNPVAKLSKYQVTDIFLGKTNSYPDGRPAVPIDQVEGSAVRNEFYSSFIGKSDAQIKAHWSKIIFTGKGRPPETVSNGIEVKEFINKNPNAIGYIDQNLVDGSVKVLQTP